MAVICMFFTSIDALPFIGDAYGGIDGAGERDVVEGEEELGEDVRVESGLVPKRPLPYCKYDI